MRRSIALVAPLLALVLALPVAAKPVQPTATITVSPEAPAYGDLITLTATTDAPASDIEMTCTHEFGQSYSYSIINYGGGTYSDDVGLSAPNWPSGGATCVADVVLYTFHGAAGKWKNTVIGSLTFTVSP